MKIKEIINVLTEAIPYRDSWVNESYGAYNIKNLEKEAKKILYCVTATQEVVQYFKKHKYDLLISHHPIIVNIPQLVFHTALDCCKNGLNDMWSNKLGITNAIHFDKNLGWAGSIKKTSFENLVTKIETFIGHKIKGIGYSNGEKISSVVVCTGLGGMVIDQAAASKADCYITGELFNSSVKGYGFKAVIEVGHTLTEFMGVNLFRSLLPNLQIDSAPLDIDYYNFETSIGGPTCGKQ